MFSDISRPGIQSIGVVSEAQQSISVIEQSLLTPELLGNSADQPLMFKELDEAWSRGENGLKSFEALPRTKEVETLWGSLKKEVGRSV